MKKFILLLVASIGLLIYYVGLDGEMMSKIVGIPNQHRPALLQSDKYRYGDLYSLSFLSDFKIPKDEGQVSKRSCRNQAKIHLYIIGDSFLGRLSNQQRADSLFCRTDQVTFVWTGREGSRSIHLDRTKPNILIIEHTERLVRGFYNGKAPLHIIMNSFLFGSDSNLQANNNRMPDKRSEPRNIKGLLTTMLQFKNTPTGKKWFNPLINQNLETLLFDYRLFTPFKELKADLNYRLLRRTAPAVVVSGNGQRLFYHETVDSTLLTSSFKVLPDDELEKIVANLNTLYAHFKSKGFDEVYFTITPNSVSINDPEKMPYNNLIKRLYENAALQMPVIDVYTPMRQHPEPGSLYFRSDTHWNAKGFQLWLDEVNKTLSSR